MQANITAVGKFVPNKVITNIEFEKTLDTSHEWIVSRTGIEERRKLELGKASSYMAIKAIEQLLNNMPGAENTGLGQANKEMEEVINDFKRNKVDRITQEIQQRIL